MEKKLGIWIDKKLAHLVFIEGASVKNERIKSKIDTRQAKGGSRSKTAYGPVITVKEKSYIEREKNQRKRFFEEIIEKMKGQDKIVIAGPGQMKNQLKKYLDDLKGFEPHVIKVKTADSMTENQIVALIKDSFYHI